MKTKDDEDTKLLRDGERLVVKMYAMDARTVLDDGLPEGVHRPGYRYIATDSAAETRRQQARDEYERDLCSRWKTNDQGEGDSCTAPDGTPGRLQFVAGKLKCVPEAAAKTSDNFGVNDDADLRELAYALYDADVSSRWKGEE